MDTAGGAPVQSGISTWCSADTSLSLVKSELHHIFNPLFQPSLGFFYIFFYYLYLPSNHGIIKHGPLGF